MLPESALLKPGSGAGGGGGAPVNASYITATANATLTDERVLTGTANQIILTDNGANSTMVVATPQDIATTSSPTFNNETLNGNLTLKGSFLFGSLAAPDPGFPNQMVEVFDPTPGVAMSAYGIFPNLDPTLDQGIKIGRAHV